MRIFYELLCTVIIEIVWTFYLKSVPAKFKKYSKHILWVISGTSSSKQSCNPRDGEYFLHRISRKLGSTATSTVITRLLPLTNYISGTENETQRALLGHTKGNIEMRSPSAAAMLTIVAAATIVRFPPVSLYSTFKRHSSNTHSRSAFLRIIEKIGMRILHIHWLKWPQISYLVHSIQH